MTRDAKKQSGNHKKNKAKHKKVKKNGWIHKLSRFKAVKGVMVTVMFMLIGVIVTNLFNKFLIGEPYKLYIVGGNAGDTEEGKMDFAYNFSQIAHHWAEVETIGGKKIIAEYKADEWNANKASVIAEEIAASNDAIMVIGHFSSTTTRKALYHYLSEDPPIPVLLTTETSPNLIPERLTKISRDLPFFRLWPTDAEQAKSIANFAEDSGKTNFWVVEDRWANQVYSHYLAKHIVTELQRKKGKNVILWSHNQNLPASNTLKDLDIDLIIFAGIASNALIFANQMEKIWEPCSENDCQKMPQLFLTDATADDKNVLIQGMDVFEGKFITHPDLIACNKIDNGSETGLSNSSVIAEDTREIFKQIIKRAKQKIKPPFYRKILGIHSVTDVRRAIASVMYESKQEQKVFGSAGVENKAKYLFSKEGINERAVFRLWKVENGMFKEYISDGGKLTPKSGACPEKANTSVHLQQSRLSFSTVSKMFLTTYHGGYSIYSTKLMVLPLDSEESYQTIDKRLA